MEFKIKCPWCKQHYSVDDSFVGQTIECSVCKKDFTVGKPTVSVPEQQPRFTHPQQNPHAEYMNQQQGYMMGYGAQNPITPQQQVVYIQVPPKQKNRGIYVILGILFGCLGFHDLYAGHIARGVAHLVLVLYFFVMFLIGLSRVEEGDYAQYDIVKAVILFWIPWLVNILWVIVELIVIKKDGKGIPME